MTAFHPAGPITAIYFDSERVDNAPRNLPSFVHVADPDHPGDNRYMIAHMVAEEAKTTDYALALEDVGLQDNFPAFFSEQFESDDEFALLVSHFEDEADTSHIVMHISPAHNHADIRATIIFPVIHFAAVTTQAEIDFTNCFINEIKKDRQRDDVALSDAWMKIIMIIPENNIGSLRNSISMVRGGEYLQERCHHHITGDEAFFRVLCAMIANGYAAKILQASHEYKTSRQIRDPFPRLNTTDPDKNPQGFYSLLDFD